jgi:hypothetical protein
MIHHTDFFESFPVWQVFSFVSNKINSGSISILKSFASFAALIILKNVTNVPGRKNNDVMRIPEQALGILKKYSTKKCETRSAKNIIN